MILLITSFTIMTVCAVEISIEGDISFHFKVDEDDKVDREVVNSVSDELEMKANDKEETKGERKKRYKRLKMVTAAAAVECVYQFPEKRQIEAILSNMMNQLAKIYLRVQEFVRKGSTESRFRVVAAQNQSVFDKIFIKMADEYRNLYDRISKRIPKTMDPCFYQSQLKSIWSRLLDISIAKLRTAVMRSIVLYLKQMPLSSKKRSGVEQLIERELSKVRSIQLDTLCDIFQLCYNELL
ncbi:uncharacterized protein LOC106131394 [Amyelois transitella]|uniref:uncharacterized protein LOC106131394 n=1 Tax=Amyelois transitella TaxID=680683 RepID=UPI0029904211|nr:uncharacterized protein LOC106131394 [Amyelois transitella]